MILTAMLVPRLVTCLKSTLRRPFTRELGQLRNCSVWESVRSEFCPMEIWLLAQERVKSEESLSRPCNSLSKMKLWALLLPSLLQVIIPISSVELPSLTFTGSTLPHWLHNWETPATTKESTMLYSHTASLTSLPQPQSTKSESGMQRTDKNFWESKFQGLSVTVFSSCTTESQSSQDGAMVKSEPFCLNLVNCFTSLMTPIIMDAQQLLQLQTVPESFQVVLRAKSEFGRSQSKPKSWRPH